MQEQITTDKHCRVAAVSADMKTFLGYGVYEGNFVHPIITEEWARAAEKCLEIPAEERAAMAADIRDGKLEIAKNPRILLDSGERVWGCECWWGPEEDFKKNGYAEKYSVSDGNEA